MFDAAEAVALRQGPLSIIQAGSFNAETLCKGIANGQPLVFHALPGDWRCAATDAAGLELACGDMPCAESAYSAPSLRDFMSRLRDGSFGGTGGFMCSAELLRWSGLPERTGPVAWGHPHLFGGTQGAVTPLHRDAGDGLNAHLLGLKEWTLLSPLHARELMPSDGKVATGFQESCLTVQQFEARFGSAALLRQVVRAGEAIFIPSGWFHEVRLLEVSLSLAAPLFPAA